MDPNKGNNCGSCKRGAEKTNHEICSECWKIEVEGGAKFSKWEAK